MFKFNHNALYGMGIYLSIYLVIQQIPMSSTITICFGGDTMLGRMTNEMIDATDYAYPWGNIRSLLHATDLNIINLETTLTNSTAIVRKVFNFKATPDKIETVKAGRIDVVNIANNHILDFDVTGLQETIATLDEAHIAHVGAGGSINAARKPTIITRNNIKIGIIGYTDNEPNWRATADKPGVNYLKVGDIAQFKQDIASLKGTVDIIIVGYHWGPNMREQPSSAHQAFAHAMIDAGVDIIHGHSAHIFQGIEIYKDKLIMYDTGDLVDDYAVDPKLRNDLSFLFFVTITKNGTVAISDIKLIATQIKNMQVNHATNSDTAWSIARIQKLSQEFGTRITSDGTVIIPTYRQTRE